MELLENNDKDEDEVSDGFLTGDFDKCGSPDTRSSKSSDGILLD